MNAAFVGKLRLPLLVFHLLSYFQIVIAGTCWSAMVRNGRCTELLFEKTTKEECCNNNHGVSTAWSVDQLDSGTLFFWKVLGGGVPCSACKDSCNGVKCDEDKMCVLKKGHPKCVCTSRCRVGKSLPKGPVCGTDGRSYRNICRLRKRACRNQSSTLFIDYNGSCQDSCDKVKCPAKKHCLVDQNLHPHCVWCAKKCKLRPKHRQVCGADGMTYISVCHLREAACKSGKAIPIAYKGKCKEKATCSKIHCPDSETCLSDRETGEPRCVTCTHHCRMRHTNSPVCGTNNSTYHSWCHMIQDACAQGFIIETKHSGKCVTDLNT